METNRSILGEFKLQIRTLLGIVALLWAIEIVDHLIFRGALDHWFGIHPRSLWGLVGVVCAPWLHGDFTHLLANTVPLITLGWLVMLRETEEWVIVSIIAALASGIGTWLIGAPNSVHIGASGVIFGYFGFLLLRGYFERSLVAIAFSVAVTFFYGSIIWGVLPTQPGVSWEGHLCGFLGGVLAARLLSKPRRKSSGDFDL